ncbi:MAG: GerMN domain-containing protein [Syntrophomonadaceae bacterium]|nr:GerMN domain-containing protein [Syntrophomonadaceae bacterium]
MDKKIVIIAAIILVAICLLAGGCSTFTGDSSLKAWKELLSLAPETETASSDKQGTSLEDLLLDKQTEGQDMVEEYIEVSLYFADGAGSLVAEDRQIVKTEGIARRTLQELLKGPENTQYKNLFPPGSQLLDINIKEDGWCIVDLSAQVRQIANAQEEQLLLNSIIKTLGQFPTIKLVSILIDSQSVDSLAGYMDLPQTIELMNPKGE